jgi:hypothetical protein
LSFQGIILRVLRLEVTVYTVKIKNQFQPTFAQRGGVKSAEVTVNSKEENSQDFCLNYVQEFGFNPGNPDAVPVKSGAGIPFKSYRDPCPVYVESK